MQNRFSDREHDKEVKKFDQLSSTWWRDDKDPLYLMNSVRIPLLKSLGREIGDDMPRVLDVGCGGGYLAEVRIRGLFFCSFCVSSYFFRCIYTFSWSLSY